SPQVAAREQAAEPAPGRTVARIGEDVGGAVGEDEPRAGMIAQQQVLLALQDMGAHDARYRVAVAKAKTLEADRFRLLGQFLATRRAAQERKVRSAGEFDIAHAKVPCMNQHGKTSSRPDRPSRKSQKRRPCLSSTR